MKILKAGMAGDEEGLEQGGEAGSGKERVNSKV